MAPSRALPGKLGHDFSPEPLSTYSVSRIDRPECDLPSIENAADFATLVDVDDLGDFLSTPKIRY